MAFDTLIAALLEEGDAKCQALLRKAQAEAERVLAAATEAAGALDREVDAKVRVELAHQRTAILARATLAGRQVLLQSKHEMLEAVWRRVTEKALALSGPDRAAVLRAVLAELAAAAPPGPLEAVIDGREREALEPRLRELGIPFEVQHREDLLLGAEVRANGEVLRSNLMTRLAKAKPDLVMELNRMLFQ